MSMSYKLLFELHLVTWIVFCGVRSWMNLGFEKKVWFILKNINLWMLWVLCQYPRLRTLWHEFGVAVVELNRIDIGWHHHHFEFLLFINGLKNIFRPQKMNFIKIGCSVKNHLRLRIKLLKKNFVSKNFHLMIGPSFKV